MFSDLMDVFDIMDATFSDRMVGNYSGKDSYVVPSFPPCDMLKEKDGTLVISLALAGYRKEDIEISTDENRLIVSTKKDYKSPAKSEDAKVIAANIKHSGFKSVFCIPETKFNFNQIFASFENGILTVQIPPIEKKEYKSITIG